MTQSSMHDSDQEPTLSVVIPCRNTQDFLGVQLAALARQECPVPWELLICDNGSTDGTVALAESWADRLPLRIVHAAEIAGSGPARNAGVEAARGRWIGFCDADDEVADDWLSALCRALEAHPFVAGRFDGERLNSARVRRSRPLDQQDGLQSSPNPVGLPHAGASNLGIHRSVFLEVDGFDPAVRHLQDTDLCWRVQLAGYPLVFVPDLLVHMRLRSSLRSMYRQGYNYGASYAHLERRYAGALARARAETRTAVGVPGSGPAWSAGDGPEGHETAAAATGDTASRAAEGEVTARRNPVMGAARLVRYFATNRSSLGAQVWQLGWHIGHRS